MVTLSDLQKRYPLPTGWAPSDPFVETVRVGKSAIALAGLSAEGPGGLCLTGSAGSAHDSPVDRSYYELLERISLLDALRGPQPEFELFDLERRSRGRIGRGGLFPESSSPERWRPSRSNGVALQLDWRSACTRAAAELVERDRVLRSWYGESAPRCIGLLPALVPEGLRGLAEWRAYEIPPAVSGIGREVEVVTVIAFPRASTIPLTYGFAARTVSGDAAAAAASEAVQRFGFLFGEDIPREPPTPTPTPDFHQEFFLYPPSSALLKEWLDTDAADRPEAEAQAPRANAAASLTEIAFVDLTPEHLRGSLFVAKAFCPRAEPLVFGDPAPHRAEVRPSRRVHPIP